MRRITEFGPHLASETVVLTPPLVKVTVPVLLLLPINRLFRMNATLVAQLGSVVSRLTPGLEFCPRDPITYSRPLQSPELQHP